MWNSGGFLTLAPSEQKYWHSDELEVKSGMLGSCLSLPQMVTLVVPKTHGISLRTWAMREVVGLYATLCHFWQVDRGDELPLGEPVLMGSLTQDIQVDVDDAIKDGNERGAVEIGEKRK